MYWSGRPATGLSQGLEEPTCIRFSHSLSTGLFPMLFLVFCSSGYFCHDAVHPGPGMVTWAGHQQANARPWITSIVLAHQFPDHCTFLTGPTACLPGQTAPYSRCAPRSRCGGLGGQQEAIARALWRPRANASSNPRVLGCFHWFP